MTLKQAQLDVIARRDCPTHPDSIAGKLWLRGFYGKGTSDNSFYLQGQAARQAWDNANK